MALALLHLSLSIHVMCGYFTRHHRQKESVISDNF
jgi:hypothetical protein